MTTKRPADGATMSAEELSGGLDGPLFLPGQPGYQAEVDGFDRSVTHRPAVVVGAASAADVVAAVRFARANGLGVAVQNTGHGVSVPADGAVLISTRRMTGYRVDAERRTATLEAGVRWQDIIGAVTKHGLVEEEYDGLTIGGACDAATIVNGTSRLIKLA